jgi:hypothetical protein
MTNRANKVYVAMAVVSLLILALLAWNVYDDQKIINTQAIRGLAIDANHRMLTGMWVKAGRPLATSEPALP